jgi:ketosteroid isomerase-like protein
MSAEENKAIARRFVEALQEFFRTGDADLVDGVLAENVVQHISGMPPEARSLEGFKQVLCPPSAEPSPTPSSKFGTWSPRRTRSRSA